jgi:hypothetical protein
MIQKHTATALSRSNPSAFSFDRFCIDCQAFIELNHSGRCSVCNSDAVSVSPSPSRMEERLQLDVIEVRQTLRLEQRRRQVQQRADAMLIEVSR